MTILNFDDINIIFIIFMLIKQTLIKNYIKEAYLIHLFFRFYFTSENHLPTVHFKTSPPYCYPPNLYSETSQKLDFTFFPYLVCLKNPLTLFTFFPTISRTFLFKNPSFDFLC